MKYLRYMALILVPVYLTLVCAREPGHEHDHAGELEEHAHSREGTEEAHSHDAGKEAHDHSHEEGGTEEGGDPHAAEEDGHAAGFGEPAAAYDEEHDDAGLIPAEGDWERLVGLETARVERRSLERVIPVPGTIVPHPDRMAVVSPFIEGSVNCVFVNVGDRVQAGDELACLSSPEIGMLRAEYDKARAELEIQQQAFLRRKKLFDDNIISEKAFQESELAFHVTTVNHDYALKKLLAVGVPRGEIENPPTGHSDAVGSTIHMHAPISGVVTARNAGPGQNADRTTHLFEIVDLSVVWCEAALFEKDLTDVRIGQRVNVRVAAYPGRGFPGRIFHIGSTLNPDSKTIRVLAEIENAEEMLKPGMFADASIVVGTRSDVLVIPSDAVLDDEGLNVVFAKEALGYHRHVVELGMASGPDVEVVSGLQAGTVVVTKGNFQLKSRMKMQGIDPHAGHAH